MIKASRTVHNFKLKNPRTRQLVIAACVLVLFVGTVLFGTGYSATMSVFNATSGKWSGTISIGGLALMGQTYNSEEDFTTDATDVSWGTDSLTVDIDGDVRFHGYYGPFTIPNEEINKDLPLPELYPGLDDCPTAKPKMTWSIVNNMRHVDVDGNYLEAGVPSVTSQENGYLVEVYYYTFSLKLELIGSRATEHDYYLFDVGGWPFGARYMYDLAQIEGVYLLPQISLTSDNESIVDMGSDLATFGNTEWKFYKIDSPSTLVASAVVLEEFRTNGQGTNRDFFLAGGDSGAGLNLYEKVDEDTNKFAVGFVKTGIPAYFVGDVTAATVLHTVATTAYNVALAIPLRMSVIITYDIPYTGDTTYGAGDPSIDPPDIFDELRDYQSRASEMLVEQSGGLITTEQAGFVMIGGAFIVLIIFGRRRG